MKERIGTIGNTHGVNDKTDTEDEKQGHDQRQTTTLQGAFNTRTVFRFAALLLVSVRSL